MNDRETFPTSPSDRLRMLALATNPVDGASTRFRVEQWRGHLHTEGVALQLEPFYPSAATPVVYEGGRTTEKFRHFVEGAARRRDIMKRLPEIADIVFVHREAFPLGLPVLLNRLGRFPGAIIYDYDDALFVPQRQGRGVLEWMERLDTPSRLMRMSDVVLAGNPWLAEYARKYCDRVVVLPTCIDTDRFKPADTRPPPRKCVVGWIGSHSTAKYLQAIIPALERAAELVPFELYVVGSPIPIAARGVDVVQAPWALEREVQDFQRCDIGVYPLFDDEWCRGKCGFKAVQFMASGVPVVAAPIGVTRDIIKAGSNGFLASTVDEWAASLTRLVLDPALRQTLGGAGRQTIEERYSLRAHAPTFTGAVRQAVVHAKVRCAMRRSAGEAWSAK